MPGKLAARMFRKILSIGTKLKVIVIFSEIFPCICLRCYLKTDSFGKKMLNLPVDIKHRLRSLIHFIVPHFVKLYFYHFITVRQIIQ